jgi:hypothetical protein
LELLGEEVVPVLRKEFEALRPAHVPEAPTHATLKQAMVTAGTGGSDDGVVAGGEQVFEGSLAADS